MSRLNGPIANLSFLRQSLLFAELSLLSYYDETEVRRVARDAGIGNLLFLDRDGAQAYVFTSQDDCIVTCRGTEPTDWNDIKADIKAGTVFAETVGRVHRGFKQEVDNLWPALGQILDTTVHPLWFTGHSLGGAMATICAGRCQLSALATESMRASAASVRAGAQLLTRSVATSLLDQLGWRPRHAATPQALFTYGSPRVGNRRYINYVKVKHYRWVNNNDMVTRVPPNWLGYRHCGREVYLDYQGQIRQLHGWERLRDRVRGLLAGLDRFRLDYFADHSITRYVQHINHAVEQYETLPLPSSSLIRPRRRATSLPAQRRAA